jgi:CYTH domain-containing protein
MPKPLEKERTFKVLPFTPDLIPSHSVAIEIEQTYLEDNGMIKRRVRKRFIDGGASYYYTKKNEMLTPGIIEEVERLITLGEYEAYMHVRDFKSQTIRKTRHCFEYAGKHFELDIYRSDGEYGFLEIEVEDMQSAVCFPSDFKIEEISREADYNNREIARNDLD